MLPLIVCRGLSIFRPAPVLLAAMTVSLLIAREASSQEAKGDPSGLPGKVESVASNLIVDLSSERASVRNAATKALIDLGPQILPVVERALATARDAEAKIRLEGIAAELRTQRARDEHIPELKIPDGLTTTKVAGEITDSTTWTRDRLYEVTGDLRIKRRGQLTLEAGVHVIVAAGVNIVVDYEGALVGSGSETEGGYIVITSRAEAAGEKGHWGKLQVAGALRLAYTDLRRSRGLVIDGKEPGHLRHVRIFHTQGDALSLLTSGVTCSNATVRDATGVGLVWRDHQRIDTLTISGASTGILCNHGYGECGRADIRDVKTNAIELTGHAYPKFADARIRRCKIGVSYREQSYGTFRNGEIAECSDRGLLVDDGSYPYLDDIKVSNCAGWGVGIYGRSYPSVGGVKFADCRAGETFVSSDSRIKGASDLGK